MAAITAAPMLSSCNEDSTSTQFIDSANVAVKSFALKRDITNGGGLDSVYFSIDLNKGVIFNADSLRKGTDIDKLVANITFGEKVDKAVITMTGGKTRTGEIDYRTNPSDSIDFTGDVTLTVGATEENMERVYRIKVNVHRETADSLVWDANVRHTLPSRLGAPKAQKTVSLKDRTVCLLLESDGTHTIASSTNLLDNEWTKREVSFPFTPDIDTFEASDNALYLLSDRGELYTSSDMATWTSTGRTWTNLIGAYLNTVVGLRDDAGRTVFDQYPLLNLSATEAPADFPRSGTSNFVTLANKWTSSPVAFFTGGAKADGTLSDATWAFDGSNWIELGKGGIPALEGASIIPYYSFRATASGAVKVQYSVWMLVGGKKQDGEFNRTVYISYDNGVSWNPGNSSMQLPSMIPTMTDCDNVVVSSVRSANLSDAWKKGTRADYTVDGDNIYWECPYIFLLGGYDPQHRLYDTIWRGVLTRLTFVPII